MEESGIVEMNDDNIVWVSKEDIYKNVIDFLMNQINAVTGDGEDFDFERAREVLASAGLNIDDYIIY
jgi:hypothetical protein